MKLTTRRSSPLKPLAESARLLCRDADELWVATAFVSDSALSDVVKRALDSGASVRFLTGTFGRDTRLRTFRHLHRMAKATRLEARIWDGDFHGKLFVWRKGSSGTVWVGSANLTDRGLTADGELVAEVKAAWESAPIRSLRKGFEFEWNRASLLDEAFLRKYKEAPRTWRLSQGSRRGHRTAPRARPGRRRGAMLVATVHRHYAEKSAAAERVYALLGNTANAWYRSSLLKLRSTKPGDLCLRLDAVDGTAAVVRITDHKRDGRGWVIAHEPFTTKADPSLNASLRGRLTKAGLRPTRKGFRSAWLPAVEAGQVVEALYGRRLRTKFEKDLE